MARDDGLVAFLYVLMRDELPIGVVDRIVSEHAERAITCGPPRFSSPHLEEIAREFAARLRTHGA